MESNPTEVADPWFAFDLIRDDETGGNNERDSSQRKVVVVEKEMELQVIAAGQREILTGGKVEIRKTGFWAFECVVSAALACLKRPRSNWRLTAVTLITVPRVPAVVTFLACSQTSFGGGRTGERRHSACP